MFGSIINLKHGRVFCKRNRLAFEGAGHLEKKSLTKEILVGIYIQSALWQVQAFTSVFIGYFPQETKRIVNGTEKNVSEYLRRQVTKVFDLVNKNLGKLDDGGFKVKFNGTIQILENSDVKMQNNYVDRSDGNITKTFDSSNMNSHTFTFQQAVENMPGRCTTINSLDEKCNICFRHNVHVRMLAILGSTITSVGPTGQAEVSFLLFQLSHALMIKLPPPLPLCFTMFTSYTLNKKSLVQEYCICNFDWFGCVITIQIKVGDF